MTTAEPGPGRTPRSDETASSTATAQAREWLHDLPVENLRLSDESNIEILARRLVDEDYVDTLEQARVVAAKAIALARAAATGAEPRQSDN